MKSKYKVTGYYYNSTRRFKTIRTNSAMHAMCINLWKGHVYELQENGKYKRIKSVY
jgi:hypothetical protein